MTLNELEAAAVLLRSAAVNAQWCSMLFHGAGDIERATRFKEHAEALNAEVREINGLTARAMAH